MNDEKITLDKNITLYAQWKIKYATLYTGTTTGKPVVRNANVQDDYYSGNYDLPRSLYALMEAETGAKNLAYSSNNSYLSIGSGSYTLTESSDTDVWLGLWFSRDGDINMNRIDSLKVIFEDEKIMTVSEAINHNYLDPLILCASSSNYGYIYGNILLLLEGGSTTSQRWVSAFLFFKVKSKK